MPKSYNERSIQIIGCDLLSQNYLQNKNHIIQRSMTYITNNQKLNNLNRFKLDILFDQLMNKLELSKSYDF